MIQDIQTVLKNNRRKNERNKDMQSRNKQCAIRAITPLAVEQTQTLDLLSTATHWWQSRTDSAQEAEATRRNTREKDDSRYTHSAQEQPKKERA